VISFSDVSCSARWSDTLWTVFAVSVFLATRINTSCDFPNIACQSGKSISTMSVLTIPHMRVCSWTDTRPPNRAGLILTSQAIKHIYQYQLYAAISEGFRIGGSTTIRGISEDLAVIAAAAACAIVDCTATQLCHSQSNTSSGSSSVNEQRCNPDYFVHCCANTGSLIYNLRPALASSVQY
jgi:hypothetical protein